jgi:GT2 family glycosyltransferase
MDVSVIIINYKSCALVMQCIESIVRETDAGTYEIIVVDNDSQDGAREKICSVFPAVRWIEMGYNSGFGRANNEGIRIAKGEFILLLNADTIILNGAIDKCVKLLKKHPEAAGGGVQLLNPDGSNQISGAYDVKGGLNALLPLPYTGNLIRWLGYRAKTTVPSITHFEDGTEIDWIVGAFIMVKKSILEKSGYFDPDFFMYSEEIEWCYRLRKNGKLLLFAEPKIVHLLGGTSNDYYETTENQNGRNIWNKKGRQVVVSAMLRIRKQLGVFWLLINAGAYIVNVFIFFICLLIEKLFQPGKTQYTWGDFVGYVSNITILTRLLPKMIFNKPYFYKVF